jgi:hypothetical protein
MNNHLKIDAVYKLLANLTPSPFPTREGEQELKPLSVSGRGLERGFNNNLHIVASTSTNSHASTQTSQLIPPSSPTIENPSAWIRDGYSPTEIILAAAILTSLLMGGTATVIFAITKLVKTLMPAMVNQTNQKRK